MPYNGYGKSNSTSVREQLTLKKTSFHMDQKDVPYKNTKPLGRTDDDSAEGLMLKLKLQYFGHLMQGTNSMEKTMMLGKIEGRRRKGQQRMR